MNSVCVFCGSSRVAADGYLAAAEALGREIGSRGLRLIYGGANIGLMGRVADAAIASGAKVIGVIPERMVGRGIAHQGLSELNVVQTMHERKRRMADLAEAFMALPGGLGTLEEVLEALTWSQLGLHQKPCGLLNVSGYFDRLLDFLDHAVAERFVRVEHREMILVDEDPSRLLLRLQDWRPIVVDKWVR